MKNFYEFLQLLEMPLTHYGYKFSSINDPNEKYDPKSGDQKILSANNKSKELGSIFSSRDKILISHPRTARMLEEKLKNSKYNFNILFLEPEHRLNKSEMKKQWKLDINKYLLENNISKENAITFVKNATSGHILTPWMILHTLGHALLESSAGEMKTMIESLSKIYDILKNIEDVRGSIPPLLFVFKSAKKENLDNPDELVHELVAEYLWNGRIRVSSNILELKSSKEILNEIKYLEVVIDKMLSKNIGGIIFDNTIA